MNIKMDLKQLLIGLVRYSAQQLSIRKIGEKINRNKGV